MPHIPNVGPEVGHPVPPGQQEGRPPPADPPPADPPSGFTPSESIFGWSWLGHWAENNADAPPEAAAWLQGWVEKFNLAAEEELSGGAVAGTKTDVVVQDFLSDLDTQTWWSGDPADPDDMGVTGLWQAVQKLRYGPEAAPGEYAALVQSYRDYVADAARRLGVIDANGDLAFDINGAVITELIEGVDGLILNAGVVVNGLPAPDPTAVNLLLDKHFLTERTFDAIEGTPTFGPGTLQDTYDWIKGLATDNFITLDDEEIWDMVFRLKREEISQQGVWDRIAGQIGDQYSFLDGTNIMNRINQFSSTEETGWGGGSNLRNHLVPVRDAVANTWGLQKGEVKLGKVFGEYLDKLTIPDETAPNGERFMNSREARQWAREQPEFLKTEEYGTGMQGMVRSILQVFGAR